jgi:hypothetical protein
VEFRIGYNKALAIMLIVVGIFVGGVALVVSANPVQLALSVLLLTAGFLFLRGTAAVVSSKAVELKNLFGGTTKAIPVQSLSDITLNGNSMVVDGKRVLSGTMVHGADIAKLREAITGAAGSDSTS